MSHRHNFLSGDVKLMKLVGINLKKFVKNVEVAKSFKNLSLLRIILNNI